MWYAENEIGLRAAVKILLPKLCSDDSIKTRFLNEAKVMLQLDHSNIRKVLSVGSIENRPAMVMEYLEGNDLKSMLKRGHQFTQEELEKWWNQMSDALNYTHAEGIVHRDIKPSNIFIDNRGDVKLLDFGIAKVRESISMTQTGAMMGTLMYMSPEQVQDSKHLDYRTDVYSLAVTFAHLLTGKAPYDTTSSNDYVIRKGIVEVPLDLSGIPDGWKGFLKPYLEKDPQKRPALRPFEPIELIEADEETIVSDVAVAVSTKDAPSDGSKKGKGIWIVIGLCFAVLTGGLLFMLLKTDPDTKAFKACKTVNDYRAYLSGYGNNAKHFKEARQFVEQFVTDSIAEAARLLAEQMDEAAYNKCNTIADCENYLKEYPNGKYVDVVQAKKADMEEKAQQEADKKEADAYEKCTTIAGCESYLKAYPNGKYAEEVKAKKAAMEADMKEADAYKKCTTIAGCESYLATYPKGKHAAEVRSKKANLEEAARPKNGTANGHDYIDLGLPSGTKWATCNVGATKPEGYGDYFAWGEYSAKSSFSWHNYKYVVGGNSKRVTKYCNDSKYGNNGFTDNLPELQNSDDPATSWGSGWHMPTNEQWNELLKNTTSTWTNQNGVNGRLFTGKNGQSIFLPCAGKFWGDGAQYVGSMGGYWSKTFVSSTHGRQLYIHPGSAFMREEFRINGYSVRPVR